MRRALIEQLDGYTILSLKLKTGRKRNDWKTIWQQKMLLARGRIIKREWEQDGNATGVL